MKITHKVLLLVSLILVTLFLIGKTSKDAQAVTTSHLLAQSTSSPTSTPATTPSTSDATPTSTPSPTTGAAGDQSGTTPPTYCGKFQDVTDGDLFQPYISCLSCSGAVSGHSCDPATPPVDPSIQCYPPANLPYFLPGNNATRGQMIKMLALSVPFTDTIVAGTQTFADVAPGSTFWLYIEQAAKHNVISGYSCSTDPHSPEYCNGSTRPYFRPNQVTTRGEAAKIIMYNIQNTEQPTPSTQTFADVPPTEPFYLWIETAAQRGIVSGYGCSDAAGSTEPCDSQRRPYYRPGNPITRAQATKLLTLALSLCGITPVPPQPAATATPGATCSKKSQGDTNCDDQVNTLDYLYYMRYVYGACPASTHCPNFPANVNIDVNNDGAVNDADKTIIINTIVAGRTTGASNQ